MNSQTGSYDGNRRSHIGDFEACPAPSTTERFNCESPSHAEKEVKAMEMKQSVTEVRTEKVNICKPIAF